MSERSRSKPSEDEERTPSSGVMEGVELAAGEAESEDRSSPSEEMPAGEGELS